MLTDKDKESMEYAVKRLAQLGYLAFTDIDKAVKQLTHALADQQVILLDAGHQFGSLREQLEEIHSIKNRPCLDTSFDVKPHGWYRQFEKRDSRKNFKK
jgi:hypothetical protein